MSSAMQEIIVAHDVGAEAEMTRTRLVEFVCMPVPLLEGACVWVIVVDELVKVEFLAVWRELRAISADDGSVLCERLRVCDRDRW